MSLSTFLTRPASPASLSGTQSWSFANILLALRLALQVYRERRALMALSDRMLADIGLSRADVDAEATRSIFDMPDQYAHDRRWRRP